MCSRSNKKQFFVGLITVCALVSSQVVMANASCKELLLEKTLKELDQNLVFVPGSKMVEQLRSFEDDYVVYSNLNYPERKGRVARVAGVERSFNWALLEPLDSRRDEYGRSLDARYFKADEVRERNEAVESVKPFELRRFKSSWHLPASVSAVQYFFLHQGSERLNLVIEFTSTLGEIRGTLDSIDAEGIKVLRLDGQEIFIRYDQIQVGSLRFNSTGEYLSEYAFALKRKFDAGFSRVKFPTFIEYGNGYRFGVEIEAEIISVDTKYRSFQCRVIHSSRPDDIQEGAKSFFLGTINLNRIEFSQPVDSDDLK